MNAGVAWANLEAYECWAPTYPPLPHNPLMRAEQQAMLESWPDVTGAQALDLACGSGRYAAVLAQRGAARIVGVDYSPAMLRQVGSGIRIRADMMALPFAACAFDFVVCGLAVGHAPQLDAWMREMARVIRPGGALLYSDFHAAAAAAGMERTFTDASRRKHTLLHRRYDLPAHCTAAAAAGLELEVARELKVGVDLREEFQGSQAFYKRWHGLPVVLVVRARRLTS